jgi:hypothetical protein
VAKGEARAETLLSEILEIRAAASTARDRWGNDEIVFNGSRYRPAYIPLIGTHDGSEAHSFTVGNGCTHSAEVPMRSTLLAITVLGSALVLGTAAGNADPLPGSTTTAPPAPIGHLQPRAQQFAPRSAGEQSEQQQLSAYDAQQQKLDEELDKKLNICSHC